MPKVRDKNIDDYVRAAIASQRDATDEDKAVAAAIDATIMDGILRRDGRPKLAVFQAMIESYTATARQIFEDMAAARTQQSR
jgi:hypothetical protein